MPMNRRTFVKSLTLSTAALAVPAFAKPAASQFAITMDDFNWRNAVKLTATERNEAILNTLQTNSIKAALFVVGRNIEYAEGKQLLAPWDKAGHLIGNHTYSHQNYAS